ncbi:MAG TPA: sigma-E processing peptidase SpoIIGA [Candidatus Scatovivens faecipullorum]|nr:sigma-E processing peptidase SpoIIGA [Candidatus Scatovivens faecipullorum]
MTIYLDIVFFENFILNYIIILSTAIISKSKIKLTSIMLSSTIGGIFSILNYLMNINSLENMILKIIISILMMLIAFNEYKIKKLIKQLLFFYLVSFTFGGIAFMLLFFIKPQNIIMKSNHLVGTYPIKITILAGILGFVVIFLIEKIIKDRLNKKSMICDLEIFYDGKIRKIKTMIDTGNLLKEPISKNDVIIVEKESLEGIVSKDILENIKYILKGKWIQEKNIYSYKIKLIPFSSLGNDNGLLLGFKPDYVKIYSDDEITRNDVLIGIYDGKLSKANQYNSLIGLDILNKEGKKNEFVQNV